MNLIVIIIDIFYCVRSKICETTFCFQLLIIVTVKYMPILFAHLVNSSSLYKKITIQYLHIVKKINVFFTRLIILKCRINTEKVYLNSKNI